MEWYRLKKLYHSIFFTAVAGASSCNGKGIDFFCQGRIASTPDKRNPIVGGGCNTPATMGFYREFRKRSRRYPGGWRRKKFDSAHHDAPSNGPTVYTQIGIGLILICVGNKIAAGWRSRRQLSESKEGSLWNCGGSRGGWRRK